MQSGKTLSEKFERTVDVQTNGWKTHLNKLGKLVATSLVAPSSLAKAASNDTSVFESEASGSYSGDYSSRSFE